jgi:hypothetical protein
MPYVLKHRETSQIYTCMLVNHYELAYYGVKFWSDEAEAAAREEAAAWLAAKGVADADAWDVVRMDEATMKLGNVKLKNDPANELFLNAEGRPVAERSKL